MTDRAALLMDLADRVEKAEGADRELDGEIWEVCGLVPEDHCRHWCGMDGRTDLTRARFIDAWAPAFTASRDAARTLLPEEWHMTIGDRKDWPWAEAHEFPQPCRIVPVTGAKTVPLAMCAVALRALASGAPR